MVTAIERSDKWLFMVRIEIGSLISIFLSEMPLQFKLARSHLFNSNLNLLQYWMRLLDDWLHAVV